MILRRVAASVCMAFLMAAPALAAPVKDEAQARSIAIAALKLHWTSAEYARFMKGQGLTAKRMNEATWEVDSAPDATGSADGGATVWISAATGRVIGLRGEH